MKENWKRTFAIIWSGQLFSTLSSSVVGFAVIFWLSIQTGSAEILALSTIATLLPQLLLGLFTGVYVDRWDRRKTYVPTFSWPLTQGCLQPFSFFPKARQTSCLSICYLHCAPLAVHFIFLQCRLLPLCWLRNPN